MQLSQIKVAKVLPAGSTAAMPVPGSPQHAIVSWKAEKEQQRSFHAPGAPTTPRRGKEAGKVCWLRAWHDRGAGQACQLALTQSPGAGVAAAPHQLPLAIAAVCNLDSLPC